jgi:hypothetical protein
MNCLAYPVEQSRVELIDHSGHLEAPACNPMHCVEQREAPGTGDGRHLSNDPDRVSVQRRLEAGLDRLLRDIERFEEPERWDGMQ